MKSKYILKLKIKGCPKTFKKELRKGVIASQEIIYHTTDIVEIATSLFKLEKDLIDEFIEVEIEEV